MFGRFFLGYLHLLVYFGVFDVIELHFGLKGHTHDGDLVVCLFIRFRHVASSDSSMDGLMVRKAVITSTNRDKSLLYINLDTGLKSHFLILRPSPLLPCPRYLRTTLLDRG